MRLVSLRKFRGEIPELREPVEVSRRDGDGNLQVLGFWTPYDQPGPAAPILDIPVDAEFPVAEDSEFDRHPRTAPIVISSPEEVADAVRPDPIRAVPKPSQRKRR